MLIAYVQKNLVKMLLLGTERKAMVVHVSRFVLFTHEFHQP